MEDGCAKMKQLIIILLMCASGAPSFANEKTATAVIRTRSTVTIACNAAATVRISTAALVRRKGSGKYRLTRRQTPLRWPYLRDKTTVDEIRKAIAATGYDADHVKAVPAAYQKLDACCKP